MNKDDVVMLYEKEFEDIEVLPTDWEFVRDDPSFNDLEDSTLSMLDTSVENSFATSITSKHNVTGILANLASEADIYPGTSEEAQGTK